MHQLMYIMVDVSLQIALSWPAVQPNAIQVGGAM